MRRLLALAAALPGLLAGTAGCGWRSGLAAPAGVRSIGVEIVQREGTVLERGLEPLLTDAISEAVVDWVELPLVDPGAADVVIETRLLDYRRRGGVRNPENQLLETAVFVRARATLVDRRTREPVGNPVIAQEWSGYALDDPSNEDAARDRAVRYVAQSLVLELFAPDPARAPR